MTCSASGGQWSSIVNGPWIAPRLCTMRSTIGWCSAATWFLLVMEGSLAINLLSFFGGYTVHPRDPRSTDVAGAPMPHFVSKLRHGRRADLGVPRVRTAEVRRDPVRPRAC